MSTKTPISAPPAAAPLALTGAALRRGPWIAVGIVAALAAYHLLEPVAGDQALGMEYGRRLRDGAVIYHDVWDIRQPLTFYWYATVGSIVHSTVFWLRIGELLWQGALAWLIARDVERMTGDRRRGVITALAAVAPLFWLMRPNDVAQPDTLVALPLYLAFRFVVAPGRRPLEPRAALLLGLGTVGIALFKLPYAPLPFLFLATWVVVHRPGWRQVARAAGWYALGLTAAAGAVVAFFAQQGVWGWVAHTWFSQGPAMRRLSPPPLSRLVTTVGRLAVLAAPVVAGAAVGLARLRRGPRDAWSAAAAVWLLGAGLALLAQQWWSYQALALVVPLGLVAGEPLSRVLCNARRWLVAGAIVCALAIAADLPYARALVHHGADRAAIARERGDGIADRDSAAAFLAAPGRIAGDVYVFGNPVILDGLGRSQRVSIHGWSPEFYDGTTWARLTTELAATPPAYLFVDGFSKRLVQRRKPELWRWIARRYVRDGALPSGMLIFRRGG